MPLGLALISAAKAVAGSVKAGTTAVLAGGDGAGREEVASSDAHGGLPREGQKTATARCRQSRIARGPTEPDLPAQEDCKVADSDNIAGTVILSTAKNLVARGLRRGPEILHCAQMTFRGTLQFSCPRGRGAAPFRRASVPPALR